MAIENKTNYANTTPGGTSSEQTELADMNSLKVKVSGEVDIDWMRYINLHILEVPRVRRQPYRDFNLIAILKL